MAEGLGVEETRVRVPVRQIVPFFAIVEICLVETRHLDQGLFHLAPWNPPRPLPQQNPIICQVDLISFHVPVDIHTGTRDSMRHKVPEHQALYCKVP